MAERQRSLSCDSQEQSSRRRASSYDSQGLYLPRLSFDDYLAGVLLDGESLRSPKLDVSRRDRQRRIERALHRQQLAQEQARLCRRTGLAPPTTRPVAPVNPRIPLKRQLSSKEPTAAATPNPSDRGDAATKRTRLVQPPCESAYVKLDMFLSDPQQPGRVRSASSAADGRREAEDGQRGSAKPTSLRLASLQSLLTKARRRPCLADLTLTSVSLRTRRWTDGAAAAVLAVWARTSSASLQSSCRYSKARSRGPEPANEVAGWYSLFSEWEPRESHVLRSPDPCNRRDPVVGETVRERRIVRLVTTEL